MSCDGSGFVGTITHLISKGGDFTVPLRCRGCPACVPPLKPGSPAVCPNGHAMDDGLFECPACGAYRPSAAGR